MIFNSFGGIHMVEFNRINKSPVTEAEMREIYKKIATPKK